MVQGVSRPLIAAYFSLPLFLLSCLLPQHINCPLFFLSHFSATHMLIIMAPTHLVPQDDRQAQEWLQPSQALRTQTGLWVDSTHLSKKASREPMGQNA